MGGDKEDEDEGRERGRGRGGRNEARRVGGSGLRKGKGEREREREKERGRKGERDWVCVRGRQINAGSKGETDTVWPAHVVSLTSPGTPSSQPCLVQKVDHVAQRAKPLRQSQITECNGNDM